MTLFLTGRRRAVVALSCLVLTGAVLAVSAPVVHGDGVVIYKVYVTDRAALTALEIATGHRPRSADAPPHP